MSLTTIVTTKNRMGHAYTESGKRVPVTRLGLKQVRVVNLVTTETGNRITLGYQTSKHISKPQRVELEKKGVDGVLNHKFEILTSADQTSDVGSIVDFSAFQPGDLVSVQGTSKGKGFAGVVKRWGFAGGDRTHGQSDRERAPGAISSGQTLGRVRPGTRMGGRMGGKTRTVKNLVVMGFDNVTGEMLVSGSVPGPVEGLILVKKIGQAKNFEPMVAVSSKEEPAADIVEVIEDVKAEEITNNEEVNTTDNTEVTNQQTNNE